MTVEFGDAVAAIAASLVNARRTLDGSTAALGRVYAADQTLSSLPVPSFTLAEADFDVQFVVEDIEDEVAAPTPLPRHTPVKVAATEDASLRRGVDENVELRYRSLVEEYAAINDLYARARQDPSLLVVEPIPTMPRLRDADIASLKTGASKAAVQRLENLLADFAQVQSTLLDSLQSTTRSHTPRVIVRMDSEALSTTAPQNIQRVRLTFRDQSVTTVEVDDATMRLAE